MGTTTDMDGECHERERGRVELVAGSCVITGPDGVGPPPASLEFLREYGTFENGRMHDFTEGETWLRLLPYNLRGTYFWAEWVEPPPDLDPGRPAA